MNKYEGLRLDLTPANTTAWVDVYTNGLAVSVNVESLVAVSTDTSARDVKLGILLAGVGQVVGSIGAVSVPAGSGVTSAAPPVQLVSGAKFGQVDDRGIYIVALPAGAKLQAASGATVTADKIIQLTGRVQVG